MIISKNRIKYILKSKHKKQTKKRKKNKRVKKIINKKNTSFRKNKPVNLRLQTIKVRKRKPGKKRKHRKKRKAYIHKGKKYKILYNIKNNYTQTNKLNDFIIPVNKQYGGVGDEDDEDDENEYRFPKNKFLKFLNIDFLFDFSEDIEIKILADSDISNTTENEIDEIQNEDDIEDKKSQTEQKMGEGMNKLGLLERCSSKMIRDDGFGLYTQEPGDCATIPSVFDKIAKIMYID